MNSLFYLFAAYMIIWVGILFYTFRISGKNRDLEKRIKAVESKIRKNESR